MKLAYILTQFPFFTETFVGREIVELQRSGIAVEIYSLKRFSDWQHIHDDMRQFEGRVHYSRLLSWAIVKSNAYWLLRRPVRYVSLLFTLLGRCTVNPGEVFKAVACYPLIAHYARLQKRAGVEHIHSHFARMGATSAWVCAELTDRPFSFTVHAFDIFLGKDDPYLHEKLHKSRMVICISTYNVNYLLEICPDINPDKFAIIRCGVDSSRISAAVSTADASPLRILAVGSLIEKKGHRYLVQAIAELLAEHREVQCEIIGEGPERAALERIIAERQLEGQVRLLGSQPQATVNARLETADIFVLACVNARDGDRDGIPVALMEAMARGKAVVSTYVSGIPELIQSHVNGILVPERNVTALSAALRAFADDKGKRSSCGASAIQTIERDYTVEQNVAKLLHLFETAVTHCRSDNCR